MTTPEEIRDFFNSLTGPGRRFETQVAMAQFLGLKTSTATTLYKFLKGRNTSFNLVVSWFEKLGGKVYLPDEQMEDFAFVPRVKAVAGCGSSLETEGGIAGVYAFRKDFLQRIHVSDKNAVMMYVKGDSMMPMITDGDTVLVDQKDNEPREGYIYLCGFGEDLMVKKLQRTPRGWKICSLNPEYDPIVVEGDELSTFRVYGRVRWIGRVV